MGTLDEKRHRRMTGGMNERAISKARDEWQAEWARLTAGQVAPMTLGLRLGSGTVVQVQIRSCPLEERECVKDIDTYTKAMVKNSLGHFT
jgi:hypothetical protein